MSPACPHGGPTEIFVFAAGLVDYSDLTQEITGLFKSGEAVAKLMECDIDTEYANVYCTTQIIVCLILISLWY